MAQYSIWFPSLRQEEDNTLTNDPTDSGGRSYYGISEVKHPTLPIWGKIDALGLKVGETSEALTQDVYDFYYKEFWTPCGGDQIQDQQLAGKIVDSAVNGGIPEAIKEMQATVGVSQTGTMDEATINALNN